LLCLAPGRGSLLAKAPLFRMPVIGFFCRAFEAIPVHRRQDASSDPAQNRETFDTARAVLARGGAIAIFPEGASHSDPKLRPLKTGAARIAFGAAAGLAPSSSIRIVPAGLYYRAKRTFRSAALLHFGEPFAVEPVVLAPGEEPPARPRGRIRRQGGARAVTASTRRAAWCPRAVPGLPGGRVRRDRDGQGSGGCAREHQGARGDATLSPHLGRRGGGRLVVAGHRGGDAGF